MCRRFSLKTVCIKYFCDNLLPSGAMLQQRSTVRFIVVVDYSTPSKRWGHGERPWSPRTLARGRRETESRQKVSGAKSP